MVLASQRHLKKSLGLGPGCTLWGPAGRQGITVLSGEMTAAP